MTGGFFPIVDQGLALISNGLPLVYDGVMKTVALGALFLLLVSAGLNASPVSAADKSPDEWIAEANNTLKADPRDAKAFYNRGTGHYNKQRYEAAIEDLSTAIALEPKAPDVYFNRGLSYRRLHRMNEAVSDFSKAIELYPAQPGYYFERCNALIVQGDLDRAVTDCSKALVLSPDDAGGYLIRGIAFRLRGDLDEALADSIRALKLDPDYADAERLLFEILLMKEVAGQSMNAPSSLMLSKDTLSRAKNLPKEAFSAEKS